MTITVPATIEELNWHKSQERETRFNLLQDEARLNKAAQVASVALLYSFARDEDNCFFNKDGDAVQMALRLTRKINPAESMTVVCKVLDGECFWFIQDMTNAWFPAQVYIAAVQERIESNRQARQEGEE